MISDKDPQKELSRWMALDVGSKRVGVAISDLLKLTARPLLTIERTDLSEDVRRLMELARQYQVSRIVVGRPFTLRGTKSSTEDLVEELASRLAEESNLPVDWADERLSTKEAESLMSELGIRVSQRRARRDQYAAAFILKWYLEDRSSEC